VEGLRRQQDGRHTAFPTPRSLLLKVGRSRLSRLSEVRRFGRANDLCRNHRLAPKPCERDMTTRNIVFLRDAFDSITCLVLFATRAGLSAYLAYRANQSKSIPLYP
jgi:hypothetical protein